jgi:hypothetical protein
MPKRENDGNSRECSEEVESVIRKGIVGTQFLQYVSRGEVVNCAKGRLLRSEKAWHCPNSVP